MTCVWMYPSLSTVATNSCRGYTSFMASSCCVVPLLPLYYTASFFFSLRHNILRNKIKIRPALNLVPGSVWLSSTCARGHGLQSCIMLTDQQLTSDLTPCVCLQAVHRSKPPLPPALTVRPVWCCANIKDGVEKFWPGCRLASRAGSLLISLNNSEKFARPSICLD